MNFKYVSALEKVKCNIGESFPWQIAKETFLFEAWWGLGSGGWGLGSRVSGLGSLMSILLSEMASFSWLFTRGKLSPIFGLLFLSLKIC